MAQSTDAINYGALSGFYDEHMQGVVLPNANKGIINEAICSTAAGTAAKTVTAPASFSLVSGATILVTFTNGISVDNATLAVGSTAAKPIYYRGAALASNIVKAGDIVQLRYDGTSYNVIGVLDQDISGKQDVISDLAAIRSGASSGTTAYQKPSGGIPDTDLSSGVQSSLSKADSALQEHQDISGKADKSATVSDVTYDSSTGKLQKTINGTTSDVCDVVTSGFRITQDDTNGIDTFTAVGQATITEDNTNGIDSFTF